MNSSSKRISPITVNLSAIPAGIPRHMSYRPNEPKPQDNQPTWYTFLEAQAWNPAPTTRAGAASDAWDATRSHMMTRMEPGHERVTGHEPEIEGLEPPRLNGPVRRPVPPAPPPVPPQQQQQFDVAPVVNRPVQMQAQHRELPVRKAPPVRLPRPEPVLSPRPAPVMAPVLEAPPVIPARPQAPAPVVQPEVAKDERARATAVHFVRDALKPEINHNLHGTSTVADRTENLPPAEPLNAGEEVMNALRGLRSKFPMNDSAKHKQAADIAAFLRNKDFVGFDERGNDRVQRRFTNDSKKLDWAGIRQRFPGITDDSVANLTSTLTRVWQYQDLDDEWLNDEPSMTAAVFKALNDKKPSQS